MTSFGLPKSMLFKIDAAVLTPMGPRDAVWRDAVIKDPTKARDAFAWWDDGPGRAELAAGLIGMWLRCPWREPLDNDERDAMRVVDGALRAARKLDPTLPIPYAEWAELRENLGAEKDRVANLREKAEGAKATIGYRRFPVECEVDAWRFDLPGSFVAHEEDDKYWATDGDRLIELVTITTDGAQSSQELVDIAPPKHPVVERIEDDRRGRMEEQTEGDMKIMHAIMASSPHVALVTCKSTSGDMGWARAAWRSMKIR